MPSSVSRPLNSKESLT